MNAAVRYADNLAEIARRGGSVRGSSLLVVRCCDCGHQYLYDEHAGLLYLRADDLSVRCDDVDGEMPPCRGCHRSRWCFEDIEADEFAEIEAGPWLFGFWSPPADKPRKTVAYRVVCALAVGTMAVFGVLAVAVNPDPFAVPGSQRPDRHMTLP